MGVYDRLLRLEQKTDVVLRVLLALLAQGSDMALHDDLLAAAKALDTSADALIAAKSAGTDAMTDVLAQLGTTKAKLDAAVTVDPPVLEGGSTAVADPQPVPVEPPPSV